MMRLHRIAMRGLRLKRRLLVVLAHVVVEEIGFVDLRQRRWLR